MQAVVCLRRPSTPAGATSRHPGPAEGGAGLASVEPAPKHWATPCIPRPPPPQARRGAEEGGVPVRMPAVVCVRRPPLPPPPPKRDAARRKAA